MRSFKVLPVVSLSRVGALSKDGLRRLEWLDWYFGHGKNAQLTCRHFCISKSVFYRWLNRFNKYNLASLEFDTKLRRPKQVRQMTTDPALVKKIYAIRLADLEKSKYEIHEELARQGIQVAHNVIQKVINRNKDLHNIQATKLASKRKMAIARIRATRELRDREIGSLVQVDTKHLYILGRKFYVFAAIDCKSRFGFVWAYATGSSANAADFLVRVKAAFPFQIQAINTDNGRVERFIKTMTYEFFNWQDDLMPEIGHLNTKCAVFNYKYQTQRFHQALNYQTPSEYVTNYLLKEGGSTVLYV